MIPPRDKAKNKCWYWVWLVFIVWIAMNISSSDITTGIILLAIGGLLTLIGQWFYRKLSHWFSPQEELCEVFFLNIDKVGNRLHQKVLRRPYNKELQSIPVYAQSNNPKEITSVNIRFGTKLSHPQKFYGILKRRRTAKRLFACPNPNWWPDFRLPTLEQNVQQPQIMRVIGVSSSGIQLEFQSIANNNGCSITFNTPAKLPIGLPFGEHAMQIDLETNASSRWKGAMICTSRVKDIDQYVVRKVDISERHRLIDG